MHREDQKTLDEIVIVSLVTAAATPGCPNTSTQIALCGTVEERRGEDELGTLTQKPTHSMMACTHILRMSLWRWSRGRPPCKASKRRLSVPPRNGRFWG